MASSSKQMRFIEGKLPGNCSEQEVNRLCKLFPNSSVRYFALSKNKDGSWGVLAQGKDKFSAKKWKELVHARLHGVEPVSDIKQAVETFRLGGSVQEIGTHSFNRGNKVLEPRKREMETVEPVNVKKARNEEEGRPSYVLSSSEMHAMARKAFDELNERPDFMDKAKYPPSSKTEVDIPGDKRAPSTQTVQELHRNGLLLAHKAAIEYFEHLKRHTEFVPSYLVPPCLRPALERRGA